MKEGEGQFWTIEDQVKKVLSEELGTPIEEIHPESELREDLGMDSVDAVNLIFALEEELGIEIPDDAPLKTVGDMVDYKGV